jgi:hypothetical protein
VACPVSHSIKRRSRSVVAMWLSRSVIVKRCGRSVLIIKRLSRSLSVTLLSGGCARKAVIVKANNRLYSNPVSADVSCRQLVH